MNVPSNDDFTRWLADVTPELDQGPTLSPSWAEWLRDLFASEGALERADVFARANAHLGEAAERALTIVLDDIERVRGSRPPVALAFEEEAHWLRYTDTASSGSEPLGPIAVDSAGALADVASVVIDVVAGNDWAIPLDCPIHGYALTVRVVRGTAVWSCHGGNHDVARVGELTKAVR